MLGFPARRSARCRSSQWQQERTSACDLDGHRPTVSFCVGRNSRFGIYSSHRIEFDPDPGRGRED